MPLGRALRDQVPCRTDNDECRFFITELADDLHRRGLVIGAPLLDTAIDCTEEIPGLEGVELGRRGACADQDQLSSRGVVRESLQHLGVVIGVDHEGTGLVGRLILVGQVLDGTCADDSRRAFEVCAAGGTRNPKEDEDGGSCRDTHSSWEGGSDSSPDSESESESEHLVQRMRRE